MKQRQRYVVVGTGGRSALFIDALASDYRTYAELVGLCDVSATRMAWYNERLASRFQQPPVPTYPAGEFDRMIREQQPSEVIVTTPDYTHHQYIIRALELGCDVISEKPLTTDADKAKAIFDTIARTSRKLRVTFNYRFAPHVTKVRELIQQGVIGQPLAVDFSWVLDTSHGADYFRRWHAEKDKSGGLLVHKATHHFDLVNWWIASYPQRVFAMGELKFYGRRNAAARGERYPYDRYTGHPGADRDPFALRLDRSHAGGAEVYSGDTLTGLYLAAEKDSGYVRDKNVFGDHVTIEDTMIVNARYRNGVLLNYSLLAYSPWEGFRVAITGTKGRVELYDKHGSHILAGPTQEPLATEPEPAQQQTLTVFPMFGTPYQVAVPPAAGGHGGSDPLLLEQLFSPQPPPDPFHHAATHIDGAAALLVGVCANLSLSTGLPVNVDEVMKLP